MIFPMTDQEIMKNWRCSKQNKEQVKILAQLNGCSARQIAEKLSALGANVPEYNFVGGCRGKYRQRMKWTDKNDRRFINMQKNGCSAAETASELGCSTDAMYHHRREVTKHLEAWNDEDESELIAMFDAGASFDTMAKRFGRSKQSCKAKLYDIYKLQAARWTDRDAAKLYELRKSGMNRNELAKLFNRSKTAITQKLSMMHYFQIEGVRR